MAAFPSSPKKAGSFRGLNYFESLELCEGNDRLYVKPSSSSSVLAIDRSTASLALESDVGQMNQGETRVVYGIIGTIRLLSGFYLIVVTRRELVGKISGDDVWELSEADLVPYTKANRLSPNQLKDEQYFQSMLQQVLSTKGFYFSYNRDLTRSCQSSYSRYGSLSYPEPRVPGSKMDHDPEFYWNMYLQRDFLKQPELSGFCLPLLHGFVQIHHHQQINGFVFDFILISRRSVYRAGTRYNRRGVDDKGNVANQLETEQMIVSDQHVFSHVQTRGSIPVFWGQTPAIKHKPHIEVDPYADHTKSTHQHFQSLQARYQGPIIAIDLIDQHGMEKVLGDSYRLSVPRAQDGAILYKAFDFHKECSRMRWHRLDILLNDLALSLQLQNYFHYSPLKDGVIALQHGAFRTNCLDCLDRTNVVQSMLARHMLEAQMKSIRVFLNNDNLAAHVSFDVIFKNTWADHADVISLQYSGTEALKTDFTRTGKRTIQGMLQDGKNSIMRFYKNNWTDGFRQDSIDLFLGNYVIPVEGAVPSLLFTPNKFVVPALIIALTLFSLFATIAIPSSNPTFQTLLVVFWIAFLAVALKFILLHGREFVDVPQLCDTTGTQRKFV